MVVTHDPLEAMVLADRLLVLEDGRVVQQGTPADVARRPATDYVARLVGLNLYAGEVALDAATVDEHGEPWAHVALHSGVGSSSPGSRRPAWPSASRVLVAVRPAAVSLHPARPGAGSPRNVWPGEVVGMEPLRRPGSGAGARAPDVLVDVTPAAVAELGLRPGLPVWVSVKATELDVYPEP